MPLDSPGFASLSEAVYAEPMTGAVTSAIEKSALTEIYITDALPSRAPRAADPGREKRAILDLAATMADNPAEVLPRFVSLAMEMTGSTSAGLSLYETDNDAPVFRWRHLHGLLAPFENATTPRDDSPCGVTLDQNRTVLAHHPEQIYDWISAENLIIPEVLLQPLYIGSTEPLGTLWVVAPEEGYFDPGHARITAELAGFAGQALKMIRAEERLQSALSDQEMLTMEMSHRLKNLFAVTDGMIRGSARAAESVQAMADSLSGRLHALASAHALVRRQAPRAGDSARHTDLNDLIGAIVEVHDPEGSRFALQGESVVCGDQATTALALVVHELATNATKYGALSGPAGRVAVHWSMDGENLSLTWVEQGGPPLRGTPGRKGFGTALIARTIEGQLRGRLDLDWTSDGLRMRASIPQARLQS